MTDKEAELERAAEALADFARDRFANTIETNWSTMGDSRQQYFRDAVATVLSALSPAIERESSYAEFEVWQDGQMVAGCSGLRADAIREACHYATVYGQDGPVEVEEIIRRPFAIERGVHLPTAGEG